MAWPPWDSGKNEGNVISLKISPPVLESGLQWRVIAYDCKFHAEEKKSVEVLLSDSMLVPYIAHSNNI